MGVSTQAFGSLCQWLINVLNLITGNFDRAGGAMFAQPAVDIVKALGKNGTQKKKNRWHSRVRKLGEFFGELPVATLADEIITEGQGQIKALITSAGNPVLSTPNGKRLVEALDKLEFQVAIDIYINETTKHADIILPPTTGLETDHYDLVFHNFAVRNTVKFSEALFPADPKARYDWQIFKELTKRLRKKPVVWWKQAFENWSTPRRLLDLALRFGPYGQISSRKLSGLSLKKVQKYPHGIDLGPLEPCLPSRLFTWDKRIDLIPDQMVSELRRLKEVPSSLGSLELLLIGRRQLRSNNSWMHNSQRLVKGPNRCTLLMHPSDAQIRDLENGNLVKVISRIGEIHLPLQISQEIMPGVVSIPHGWGHHNVPLAIASEYPGVSINDLTDPLLLDQFSGNTAFSGVPVEVS
jgi:anaerobic selenocysteine-containing dehydrogenase